MYRFGPLTTSLRLSLVRRAGVSVVPQFVPSDGNALTFPIQRFNIYQPKRFDVIRERKQFQSRRIRIRRPEETEVEAIQRLCDQIISDINEDKFLFNLTDQEVSNRMCTISPKIAVDLAINMFEKEGLEKTIQFLNGCKKRFTIRSRAKPSIEVTQGVRGLYRRLFETIEPSDTMALQLSDALIRAEIVQTPDIFLDECVKRNLEKHNFGVAFGSFASKSTAERSVSGCSRLFDFILADEQDFQCVREQRIKMVVNHVQSLKTPAYALAELVTASLKINKMEDAEILVKYFVVKPRNFVECVKRLREDCDLITLERFGTLFAKCYYEQLRSKPKKTKKSTKIEENLEKLDVEVEEEVAPEVLGQFEFLVKEARVKKRRRQFTLAKKTVKKHEIDPKQLDLLTRVFVNVWITSAVEKADTNSLASLFEWVSYHNVELREFQFDRLRECHIKAGIPNPFSKLQKNSNQISERAQLQGLF